jgi:hypothetical protein
MSSLKKAKMAPSKTPRYEAECKEKHEIIRLVEGSDLPVKLILEQLGIARSTFYNWYSGTGNQDLKACYLR